MYHVQSMHIWEIKRKGKRTHLKFFALPLDVAFPTSSRIKFMYSSKPCKAKKLTFEQTYMYSLKIVK